MPKSVALFSLVICQIHIYNLCYVEKIKCRSQRLQAGNQNAHQEKFYTMDGTKMNALVCIYLGNQS